MYQITEKKYRKLCEQAYTIAHSEEFYAVYSGPPSIETLMTHNEELTDDNIALFIMFGGEYELPDGKIVRCYETEDASYYEPGGGGHYAAQFLWENIEIKK